MSWFSIFRRRKTPRRAPAPIPRDVPVVLTESTPARTCRHFYNEPGFQTYASFFAHWEGWITAGHCMTDVNDLLPPFASGDLVSWPGGLDGALIGCALPAAAPPKPVIGHKVIMQGYPAGSRTMETREGVVYIEREHGVWIAHITDPDEPVVTGMSGGPVLDADTGEPIGVIITRNSPADLNNDRDPDESCDFVSLHALWLAAANQINIA